jgi:hypothetical protein
MESTEFRNLLLLLREDLQDKDIPHRTTMTKRIMELSKEQTKHLSSQMLVSSDLLFIFELINFYFFSKVPWERSPLPWTCGQTLT